MRTPARQSGSLFRYWVFEPEEVRMWIVYLAVALIGILFGAISLINLRSES